MLVGSSHTSFSQQTVPPDPHLHGPSELAAPSLQLSRTHVREDMSQISPLSQTLSPHVHGYAVVGAPSKHACLSLLQVLVLLSHTSPS